MKSAIDSFRAHLPEVQTLGNPGLRDRHWEKISEIVGFPIKADSETTLAKIIDLNLTDYIRFVTAHGAGGGRSEGWGPGVYCGVCMW